MFERFTERARQVTVIADAEAGRAGAPAIETEHLLLGLLAEAEGLGAQVLLDHNLTFDGIHNQVIERWGQEPVTHVGLLAWSERGRRVLELSLRDALSLGHNYIGTEHLLLGLSRIEDGHAAELFAAYHLDRDEIVNGVMAHLNRPARLAPRTPLPTPVATAAEALVPTEADLAERITTIETLLGIGAGEARLDEQVGALRALLETTRQQAALAGNYNLARQLEQAAEQLN